MSASGSYAEAAELAAEWGVPVGGSTLRALAQEAGARAEEQTRRRLETPAPEREPERAPPSALSILLVDGCLLRFRGPGRGKASPQEPRVEWHELKLGVFYREGQAAQTAGGRGLLSDKRIASWRDEAGTTVRREQDYLARHAARMNYRELSRSGPIGSGAVESAYRQRQRRFKRAGQFWTEEGLKHLCALQEARRNHHWEDLWGPAPQPR